MTRTLLMALLSLAALMTAAGVDGAERPVVPDLTRGGRPDQAHDWLLGPTGARGWIWGWHCQTTDARQILITTVAKGSPADGVLDQGDVVLGVDGKTFTDDARITFARAITAAERDADGGALHLLRWRQGRTDSVTVKLPVLGGYAPTAPYDCAKSRRILAQGCQAIARQGLKDKRGGIRICIEHDLNALALLASGDESYRPLVAEYAHAVAASQPGGHISWGYGYETLFLAEYALATRDDAVMPGLRRLALDIARGASGVGTWGHSFARAGDHILNGYGCMNQPGIILTMAMVLARTAGVLEPDLDRTITKASGFLRWYVGKGAVPYGDHDPWPWHEDNGKCSSAAVLFDWLGDREATAFFSRMAAAAYGERESGHTGNFFNILWALPGVARGGAAVTAAYVQETAWYYDLARGWDGSFAYQGLPGDGRANYSGWDCTGAFLLGYALPLKTLYLTGNKPCAAPALAGDEVVATMAAGRDFTFWTEKTCYAQRSTEALLAGLSNWSPAVRKRSAQALGGREGDLVPRLLAMLGGATREIRYGACEALGQLGPRADAAATQVRALLAGTDPWLRILAAEALARMGPDVRMAAVPDLLRAAALKDPMDRRERVQGTLSEALFTPGPGKRDPKGILSGSLDGVDRPLLYAAIREVLTNEDGRIRGLVAPMYRLLTPTDIAILLPDILAAIRTPAPSGEMFADGIRLAGIELLSRLRIREGMGLAMAVMEPGRWGQDHRVQQCLAALVPYAGAARDLVPRLQEARLELIGKNRDWEKQDDARKRNIQALDRLVIAIGADRSPPPLRDAADYIRSPTPAGGMR